MATRRERDEARRHPVPVQLRQERAAVLRGRRVGAAGEGGPGSPSFAGSFGVGFLMAALVIMPVAAIAGFLAKPDPTYTGTGMYYGFLGGLAAAAVLGIIFARRASRGRAPAEDE